MGIEILPTMESATGDLPEMPEIPEIILRDFFLHIYGGYSKHTSIDCFHGLSICKFIQSMKKTEKTKFQQADLFIPSLSS